MRFIARYDGTEIPLEVERHGTGYRVKRGDRWIEADLVEAGPSVRSLRLEDGTHFSLLHHREGNEHQVTIGASQIRVEIVDPLALKRKRRDDESGSGGVVKALMPGRIVRVLVAKGDPVRKGMALLILEAMKMENEIPAPADGVVDELFVAVGQTVEAGAELVHVTS
ncbi:MAG: mccA [Acidobacteria bacterium]|nr:mccA [Acidobacteriota bacterium]